MRLLLLAVFAGCCFGLDHESEFYRIDSQASETESKRLGTMMDGYYAFLSEVFSYREKGDRLSLRIFTKRPDFDRFGSDISGFSELWYGFYSYSQTGSELVVYYDGTYTGIFFHEGFHQFAHRCFPNINVWPQWFNEGMAAYLETATISGKRITPPKAVRQDYVATCRKLLTEKRQPLIADFQKIMLKEWNASKVDYAIGAALIGFFMGSKDAKIKDLFRGFMSALRESQDYDKAYAATFGKVDMQALDKAFWSGLPK